MLALVKFSDQNTVCLIIEIDMLLKCVIEHSYLLKQLHVSELLNENKENV